MGILPLDMPDFRLLARMSVLGSCNFVVGFRVARDILVELKEAVVKSFLAARRDRFVAPGSFARLLQEEPAAPVPDKDMPANILAALWQHRRWHWLGSGFRLFDCYAAVLSIFASRLAARILKSARIGRD